MAKGTVCKWTVLALVGLLLAPVGWAQTTGQVRISLNPTSIDFDDIVVDLAVEVGVEVTLTESGQALLGESYNLSVSRVRAPFSIEGLRKQTLGVGEKTAFQVFFTPKEGGSYSAAVILTLKDSQNRVVDSQTFEVRGQGVEPVIQVLSPLDLNMDFGDIEAAALQGSVSSVRLSRDQTEQLLTVFNDGTDDLIVTATMASDFFEFATSGSTNVIVDGVFFETFTIAPDRSQDIRIRIRTDLVQIPKAGRLTEELLLESNDRENPKVSVKVMANILVPRYSGPSSISMSNLVVNQRAVEIHDFSNSGKGVGVFEFHSTCQEVSVGVASVATSSGGRGTVSIELEGGETAILSVFVTARIPGRLQCDVVLDIQGSDQEPKTITTTGNATRLSLNAASPAPALAVGGVVGRRGLVFAPAGVGELVRLQVFDLNGHQVFDAAPARSGLVWPLVDAGGGRVANGVYLYRLMVQDPDGQVRAVVGKVAVFN